jgi:ribosome-associated translation inhibitor RaiA
MLIHVTTDNHIQGRERLVGEVEAAVQDSLQRYAQQIMRVEVHLSDENGKKPGDDDKKCTLEARLAGLQPVAVSGHGANLDQALSSALDKLLHALDHKLGRLNDRKGRTSFGGEGE